MTRTNSTDMRSISDYRAMRRRLFVLAVGGVLLLVLLVQWFSHLLNRSLLDDSYAQLQQQLVQVYQEDVRRTLEHQAAHLSLLLHNPVLIDAIRRTDRETMMREVYWQYQQKRQDNPHLEILHFHNPNNITLLRLHQPANYGDDLSELRPMIADANFLQQRQDGFEIGKNGISYRVAIPISDDGEHLGVVEMGVNIAHFTDRLSQLYGMPVGMFFHRRSMQTYLEQHGQQALLEINEDTLVFPPMSDLMHAAGRLRISLAQGYVSFYYQGGRYVAHWVFAPTNYLDEEVGYLVVVADVSRQTDQVWKYTLWGSVAWIVLLLLLVLGQYRIFERMQQSIHNLAFYDPLTRLPNRRLLQDRMHQSLLTCMRSGQHMGLLFIDLDNFKQLNDTHGHHYGDELLKQVAERLREGVRTNDSVGRQGGDEFVIVLEGLGDNYQRANEQAQVVAEKIVQVLDEPYELSDGLVWHCSGSIGIAVCDDSLVELEELVRRADVAMYQAKAAGRNRYFVYSTNPDPGVES